MDDPNYFIDIIIFGAITLFLIFRLKSVLGKKHGEERERPNIYEGANQKTDDEKVIDLKKEKQQKFIRPQSQDLDIPPTLAQGIAKIEAADPYFSEHKFIKGAKFAFEMIVKAFAEGDQGTLKKLASHEISSEFIKMIKQREKKEQRLEVKIDRILDIDILKADLVNNEAFVTMTITSLQIIALFDKKNKVIEGNAEKSQEVVDRWTFKKDVTKKDPNWLLIETSAAL